MALFQSETWECLHFRTLSLLVLTGRFREGEERRDARNEFEMFEMGKKDQVNQLEYWDGGWEWGSSL